VQLNLVRLLSTDSLLFMGVGDLSIYSWRQRGPKVTLNPRHGRCPGCDPEGCDTHTGKGVSPRVIACEHGKAESNFIVKEQERSFLMSSRWEIINMYKEKINSPNLPAFRLSSQKMERPLFVRAFYQ